MLHDELVAPFLMQVPPFLEAMMNTLLYARLLETIKRHLCRISKVEARTLPRLEIIKCRKLAIIARGRSCSRADATIVAKDGKVTKYDVIN